MQEEMNVDQSVTVRRTVLVFKQKLPQLIIVLFSVLLALGMYYHEMWRDELDIYGRIGLNGYVKYSEHDYSYLVYNLLMKAFLWVNGSQMMYQFYHYVIIVAAIFLLNKYSPFSLFEKFFLTFSYFLFFEYGILSRYYGFLILMLFLIMYLLSRKRVNYYLIIIPLIVLANHSINSFIIILPLFVFIVNKLIEKFKKNTLTKSLLISYVGVFLFFIFMGVIYVVFTYGQKSRWDGVANAPFFMTIRTIWNSFIPLPEFTSGASFWNTNYFSFPDIYPMNYDVSNYLTTQNIVLSISSIFIFIIILIKFSNKPVVFWIFFGNCILLLLFLHTAKFYYIRHQGLLFIVFIYCYWLYHIADEGIHIPILNKIKLDRLQKLKIGIIFKPMISLFLIMQFVSSCYAFYKDVKYKFTLSHETAKFIKTNKLETDHEFVGFIDFAAQTIAINLKKKTYFPQSNSIDYVWNPFDKNYKQNISISEVLDACINYSEIQKTKVILILNFPLMDNHQTELSNAMLTENSSIALLKSFTGDIIQTDEQFWLYEVRKIEN